MIIGGKLNFDAYNNGGEWIDSVFDVGPDLVRKNFLAFSSFPFLQLGFVHAEDQYWEEGHFTGDGKAFKSVSLGRSEKGKVASICNLYFSRFEFNFSQFVAKTWESHGQGRAR